MKGDGGASALFAQIVGAGPAPTTSLQAEFKETSERDYRLVLRIFLSTREARQIFGILLHEIPGLNRTLMGETNRRYIKKLVTRAGAKLEAVRFGEERRNLVRR